MRTFLLCALFFIHTVCFSSIEDLKFLYEKYKDTEGLQFNSQFDQDRYLYQKFFKGKRNGVFVDIGAHDGVSYSNTYFYEKFMGWTGICIEPIPEVFESLQKARNAICIQGCISPREGTAQFLRIRGEYEMFSGILDNYDPEHKNNIQVTQNGSAEIITVQCYDLTRLLKKHGITHVDYMSIDTEGGELGILQSLDFQAITVDVIDVENNAGTDQFKDFLEPLGYRKIIKLGVDEIYRKGV